MTRTLKDCYRAAIIRRFRAGRSVAQLAREYGRIVVERTLRWAVR